MQKTIECYNLFDRQGALQTLDINKRIRALNGDNERNKVFSVDGKTTRAVRGRLGIEFVLPMNAQEVEQTLEAMLPNKKILDAPVLKKVFMHVTYKQFSSEFDFDFYIAEPSVPLEHLVSLEEALMRNTCLLYKGIVASTTLQKAPVAALGKTQHKLIFQTLKVCRVPERLPYDVEEFEAMKLRTTMFYASVPVLHKDERACGL